MCIGVAHHVTALIFYNITRYYGKHVAVFAVAVAAGDIIKYQSFVYGNFVWGIHVRYNNTIYHECEGSIEKSVPRIGICHHKACQVMTNGDPEGWIFLSYPHTNNGFFFLLITLLFIYFKISLQKSLNMLRCNFT